MSTEQFNELHTRLVISGDPDKTATAIMVALKLNVTQRAGLGWVILRECEHRDRNESASVERSAFHGGTPADPSALKARLMLASFALGDGRRVLWGEATPEEHDQRIAMLTKIRDGIDATILRHMDAAAKVRAAGVSCLNDIDDLDMGVAA